MAASGGISPVAATPVVVFDLDDTLYPERDFALSGYRAAIKTLSLGPALSTDAFSAMASALDARKNPFDALAQAVGGHTAGQDGIRKLVGIYRTHYPDISLPTPSLEILEWLRAHDFPVALVTDGRSLTQRNKIAALGLGRYLSNDSIFISEETGHPKPDAHSFLRIMDLYGGGRPYIYIGDNPAKDFITPNTLGWTTVALRSRGSNIHPQPLLFRRPFSPDIVVESLTEIKSLLALCFMEKRKFFRRF